MLTSRTTTQIAAAIAVLGFGSPIHAQTASRTAPTAPALETIMNRNGDLVAPWKYVRACRDEKRTQCSMAVVHSKTREIAKVGEQWSSRFERTGNGLEVKRAESAIAKAARLKGEATKP
jgi:hypothetical protein